MFDRIQLTLVQTNAVTGETERNIMRAADLIRAAVNETKPNIVVLPEFFNTGYFPLYWDYSYMALAEDEQGRTVSTFRRLASELRTHIAVPFYEIAAPGLYYNTTLILAPNGDIVAKYRKTHPPARVSVEKLFYRAGSRLPVFSLFGWRLGILMCYDSYVPEPARALLVQGAEIVVVPFAEVEGFHMWISLLSSRAFENGLYLGACNLVGADRKPPKAIMGGRSLIIDPEGHILSEASANEEGFITATLERKQLIEVRTRRQFLRDRRPELYKVLTSFNEDARGLKD